VGVNVANKQMDMAHPDAELVAFAELCGCGRNKN
jgi:hypothetical protein